MVHIRIQYILSMVRSYGFFSDFEEYGCLRTDMCFATRLPGSKQPFKKASNFFSEANNENCTSEDIMKAVFLTD